MFIILKKVKNAIIVLLLFQPKDKGEKMIIAK